MSGNPRRLVFFADLLGFGGLAVRPGANKARDALSHLARLLSGTDELAKLVQSPVWSERYGLSDSVFLLTEDLAGGCVAASELFFTLAYVQVDQQSPVFLRGALTWGEAHLGEICAMAARLFLDAVHSRKLRPHYEGFLGISLRSLEWLEKNRPDVATTAREASQLAEQRDRLQEELEPSQYHRLDALLSGRGGSP